MFWVHRERKKKNPFSTTCAQSWYWKLYWTHADQHDITTTDWCSDDVDHSYSSGLIVHIQYSELDSSIPHENLYQLMYPWWRWYCIAFPNKSCMWTWMLCVSTCCPFSSEFSACCCSTVTEFCMYCMYMSGLLLILWVSSHHFKHVNHLNVSL